MRILSAGVCGSVATDVASATHRLVRRGIGRHAQGVDPEPRMSEIPWMIMDNTQAARDLGRHIACLFSKASRNTPANIRAYWR